MVYEAHYSGFATDRHNSDLNWAIDRYPCLGLSSEKPGTSYVILLTGMLTDFILLFLLLLLYGKANYNKTIKYKLKVQLKFLTISLAYMPPLPVVGMAGIHQFALPEASLYYI